MSRDLPEDEWALRNYLADLKVTELRALANDMVYRWEARRVELIDFLVMYAPARVREHRADTR